jgi:hypothetical protein
MLHIIITTTEFALKHSEKIGEALIRLTVLIHLAHSLYKWLRHVTGN